MTAVYLILHACLILNDNGTCAQSVLINDRHDAMPSHRCIIEVTKIRRAFLAHREAGYLLATHARGQPATLIGAACSPEPACECEVK